MKPVTLKQIAETLGISVTTVSKALKDYPDVSKKTKRLVKELAETLNYRPNAFAVTLRTKESKTIGLI
ncbi:MAG: LacI family DNA-binding transcriptional regulator, partial [Winogradskyella sp.]|nr:LacI family DNA-binding transcriptional regulator [Winogradskyella sp.]